MADFYRRDSGNDIYGFTSGRSEIDLRQEMINLLDGHGKEIPKAREILIRRLRRDSKGKPSSPCGCINPMTKEPDRDRFCPVCMGEGWLWDEIRAKAYRINVGRDIKHTLGDSLTEPGLINVPLVVFYVRYSEAVDRGDKIVELKVDLEGVPTTPQQRNRLFRVNVAYDYRADNGRLEYWKLFTHKEDTKYLNVPGYEEV